MPRAKKPNPVIAQFHDWAREAQFNDEFPYHLSWKARDEAVFKYARKLQKAGLVMLFQRRAADGFIYYAKRSPILAHVALDEVSRSIYAPPSAAFLAERSTETL